MPTVLLYALGAAAFVVAILVSIGLHELGHLYFAKRFGAKVTQYFIGFGPTLWSRHRGETEYGVKAIPLGGFVRIIGMMPPVRGHFEKDAYVGSDDDVADDDTVQRAGPNDIVLRSTNTGLFTGLVANAKQSEYETIRAEDEPRLFYRLTWWRKFVVMAAGPAVNMTLAFLCFLGVFAIYGQEEARVTPGAPIVAQVVRCATGEFAEPADTCSARDESPAYAAGVRTGDRIVGFNGVEITSWTQLTTLVQRSGPVTADLTVDRDGETVPLRVTTREFMRADGAQVVSRAYLGVAPQVEVVREQHGVVYTVKYMGERTVDTFKAFADIPAKVKNVVLAIVGVEQRDPNGPVSIVGGARFSGEVAAYENGDVPGLEISGADKVAGFFLLVAGFNLFLAWLNFLPIPPLDGGHMAGALWEGMKTAYSRLFKRPAPKPFDISKLLPLAYAFGMMMFLLGMVLIIGDFVVPIRLFS